MINVSYKCIVKKLVLWYVNLNLGFIMKVIGFFLIWLK